MRIYTSYGIRLKDAGKQFDATVKLYRLAVQFFLSVCDKHWEALSELTGKKVNNAMEKLTVRTRKNPAPQHPFEDERKEFYKFPSYLRRAAIAEAIGMCSSYRSRLKAWEEEPKKCGRKPSIASETSMVMPAMYAGNMFLRTGLYTAKLKVFRDNTWDWIEVSFRKTDADYIRKHCSERKECVPILQKRHGRYELRFAYEESVKLPVPDISEGAILSVDLGINNACTVCAMKKDGTVLLRRFLKLRRENDCLAHALNRIRKAQRNGAKKRFQGSGLMWKESTGTSP